MEQLDLEYEQKQRQDCISSEVKYKFNSDDRNHLEDITRARLAHSQFWAAPMSRIEEESSS